MQVHFPKLKTSFKKHNKNWVDIEVIESIKKLKELFSLKVINLNFNEVDLKK